VNDQLKNQDKSGRSKPSKLTRGLPSAKLVRRVKAVLADHGITDLETTGYVLYVLRERGLFWKPQVEPKTTTRMIKTAANAQPPGLKRKLYLANTFQSVRGDRYIPIGPHAGRRPELEIDYSVYLLDRELDVRLGLRANKRRRVIAEVLCTLEGRSWSTLENDRVRKRLQRNKQRARFDETDYMVDVHFFECERHSALPPSSLSQEQSHSISHDDET
jgi:hypothetical protein